MVHYEGVFFGQFVPKIKNDEGKPLYVIVLTDTNEAEHVKFFVPKEDYGKLKLKTFISRDVDKLTHVAVEVNDDGEYPTITKVETIGYLAFADTAISPTL